MSLRWSRRELGGVKVKLITDAVKVRLLLPHPLYKPSVDTQINKQEESKESSTFCLKREKKMNESLKVFLNIAGQLRT